MANSRSISPNTDCGRTRTIGFSAGSGGASGYLRAYASISAASASGSVGNSAVPWTITGSSPSVWTVQRGSARRLRALRDRPPVLNHRQRSSHTAHTGITCGAPPGEIVTTQ